jgi:hypothetical protein
MPQGSSRFLRALFRASPRSLVGLTTTCGIAGFALVWSACRTPSLATENAELEATPGDPPEESSVVAYATECKRELGITQPLPALNCLDGEEIPIAFTAGDATATVTAATWNAFVDGDKRCDNPHWLSGDEGCFTYDHLQTKLITPDVIAVLNCRQKYFTPGKNGGLRRAEREALYQAALRDPRATDAERAAAFHFAYSFNDLGLILKNTRTGKTCFFTAYARKYFGPALPPPDAVATPGVDAYGKLVAVRGAAVPSRDVLDAPLAAAAREQTADWEPADQARWIRKVTSRYWSYDPEQVYNKPDDTARNGHCVTCHDMGGLKHSPFIMSAEHVTIPSNGRGPYLPVGRTFQQVLREADLLDVTTAPVDGKKQECTSCHRMIARGPTCNTFFGRALGLPDRALAPLLTAAARTHPGRAWMPLDDASEDFAGYLAAHGKHIARMYCCCRNPLAAGCFSKRYGPTEAEVDAKWRPGRSEPGGVACDQVNTLEDVGLAY